MDDVERVARALCRNAGYYCADRSQLEPCPEHCNAWTLRQDEARAAIAALAPVVPNAREKRDGLSGAEIRAELQRAVDAAGGMAKWAKKHDLSYWYVSDILNGIAGVEVSSYILGALGLEQVTIVRRIVR